MSCSPSVEVVLFVDRTDHGGRTQHFSGAHAEASKFVKVVGGSFNVLIPAADGKRCKTRPPYICLAIAIEFERSVKMHYESEGSRREQSKTSRIMDKC